MRLALACCPLPLIVVRVSRVLLAHGPDGWVGQGLVCQQSGSLQIFGARGTSGVRSRSVYRPSARADELHARALMRLVVRS
jgi:hypothetical protein